MFSLFQITFHLHKQLPPIHSQSQTFLHFIPASWSLRPHLQILPVVFVIFICLFVDCVSEWPLE